MTFSTKNNMEINFENFQCLYGNLNEVMLIFVNLAVELSLIPPSSLEILWWQMC